MGADWLRVKADPASRRVTLYGFKGGVGRTSATFLLAERLAETGRCVLVVDLDLESPGIGPLLQTETEAANYGLVDFLIEAALGDHATELDVVARSNKIQVKGNGEVWVAPARGRPRAGYSYLPKLNRIYADLTTAAGGRATFADRLDAAISFCEAQVGSLSRRPDVVLLDSRAGIHDVAAAAISRLSDLTFLFATDNEQTWTGYGDLFQQWADADRATVIRERLRTVAALTPPGSASTYLSRFRDRAQDCFATSLYDDATTWDAEAFNPAPDDVTAPHYAVPILFVGEMVGLDPSARANWQESELIRAAFREFLDWAAELAVGDTND
ncbi:AAA family ATPase [Kineosporia sp. J2-2]|uniref:AAA family ATPase n=1 Tax=Kineosporia corallincola TaxID=2835133 RepID=A0ABS5TLC6_9ACTN|nr:AAA family ATPase [Kineosporia corallincola]MBT0770966.1 AAA family ATPase [Kineosporia corallincola]